MMAHRADVLIGDRLLVGRQYRIQCTERVGHRRHPGGALLHRRRALAHLLRTRSRARLHLGSHRLHACRLLFRRGDESLPRAFLGWGDLKLRLQVAQACFSRRRGIEPCHWPMTGPHPHAWTMTVTHAAIRLGISGSGNCQRNDEGKEALTLLRVLRRFGEFATIVEARPITGRTHQIRVHALHAGHMIAGDSKYGDEDFSREIRELGGKRLFLHAYALTVPLPDGGELKLEAPVDEVWAKTVERLSAT